VRRQGDDAATGGRRPSGLRGGIAGEYP